MKECKSEQPLEPKQRHRSMTLTEKILVHHAIDLPRSFVAPGDTLRLRVDWTMASELAWNGMSRTYDLLGRPGLFNTQRVYLALDHTVDPVTLLKDERTKRLVHLARTFARDQGLRHFYDANITIMHTKFYRDLVQPGQLVVGADSHTTSHGALGAFAIGLGGADVTAAMVLGEIWLEVPQSIAIDYTGVPPFGIGGKDIILATLRTLGRNTAAFERSVEFRGPATSTFSTDTRFAICNMTAELGGISGIFEADAQVFAWLQKRAGDNDEAVYFRSDPGAEYAARFELSLQDLVPQVARPASPDNVVDASELQNLALDGCFIGACTTTEEDLVLGGLLLESGLSSGAQGVERPPGYRLMVPGSTDVAARLREAGLLAVYERAGFIIDPPGCSLCLGIASRRARPGEVWLSSQNRNFPNRMGQGSLAFLASAATTAASSFEMRMKDPCEALEHIDRDRYARILQRDRALLPEISYTQPEPRIGKRNAVRSVLNSVPEYAVIRARAQVFGDSIDTDAIIPGEFCHLQSPTELGPFCFRHTRPDFVEKVQQGFRIVVAGEAWGTGSSREQAAWALMGAGVELIIAKSFAFIHKRNLVNEALPFLSLRDPDFFANIKEGDELLVELESGEVRVSGRVYRAESVSGLPLVLLREGGLVPGIRNRGLDVFNMFTREQ